MNITTDNVADLTDGHMQPSSKNTASFVVNLLNKKTPIGTKLGK